MICKDDLTIRSMTEADIHLLYKWLNDSRVSKYYGEGNISLSDIKVKYLPRIQEHSTIKTNILEYKDKAIGYMQYYPFNKMKDGKFGIDQLIGEVDYWNKGLGTDFIKLMLKYLSEKENALQVILDVDKENIRAIKCYQKCGFEIIGAMDEQHYNMLWKV